MTIAGPRNIIQCRNSMIYLSVHNLRAQLKRNLSESSGWFFVHISCCAVSHHYTPAGVRSCALLIFTARDRHLFRGGGVLPSNRTLYHLPLTSLQSAGGCLRNAHMHCKLYKCVISVPAHPLRWLRQYSQLRWLLVSWCGALRMMTTLRRPCCCSVLWDRVQAPPHSTSVAFTQSLHLAC